MGSWRQIKESSHVKTTAVINKHLVVETLGLSQGLLIQHWPWPLPTALLTVVFKVTSSPLSPDTCIIWDS